MFIVWASLTMMYEDDNMYIVQATVCCHAAQGAKVSREISLWPGDLAANFANVNEPLDLLKEKKKKEINKNFFCRFFFLENSP